jgi:hypothetical protein
MLGSGIIDVAIGLAFVFGVTAALSSVFTELISRFLGLRGAYLLAGLRELLDGPGGETVLNNAIASYHGMKALATGPAPTAATPAAATPAAAPASPAMSATGALLGSPILRSQGMTGEISKRNLAVKPRGPGRPPKVTTSTKDRGWRYPLGLASSIRARRSLPSYISAKSFGEAVIDLLVPDKARRTTMTAVQKGIGQLPPEMGTLKESLQALATNAGDDITLFRTSVESWYDDHMSRVSGWYKRHVAKITLVIGAVLVVLLNINTITIGRTLYSNSVVRTAVSAVAAKSTSCQGKAQPDCLAALQSQLSATAQAGLPIGWGTVAGCVKAKPSCSWLQRHGILTRGGGSGWQVVLVIVGFLITIIALTPGARFWFDLLGKLGSLRSTGPKPASP